VNFPTWLSHIVKSGKVSLTTKDLEVVQIKADNKQIEFNILNKMFLKDVLDGASEENSIREKLNQFKSFSLDLKDEGITFIFSYNGEPFVKIGSKAKPRFLHLVTGTDSIEIKNLQRVMKLLI